MMAMVSYFPAAARGVVRVLMGAAILWMAVPQPAHSADCARALETVFGHEGGYQNFKKDAGNWSGKKVGAGKMCGGTKFGIACGHNPGVDVKNLTREQAAVIYQNRECRDIRINELNGETVPTLLLDLSVHMGSDMAVKLAGTTMNLLSPPDKQLVFEDVMTDEMVSWFNDFTQTRDGRILFFSVLTLAAIDRYAYIVESNKNQAMWLLGWVRRVIPNEIEMVRPNRTLK